MGNSHSEQAAAPAAEPSRPKHILWACETAEEHYTAIQKACELAANQHGEEGLLRTGFEFRMVHAHPCDCDAHSDIDVESLSDDESQNGDYLVGEGADESDQDDERDREDDVNDKLPDDDILAEDDYQLGWGQDDSEHENEFMVPLGTSINQHIQRESEKNLSQMVITGFGESIDPVRTESYSKPVPKTQSSVSLFSLSTHYSIGSSASEQGAPPVQIHGNTHEIDHETCALRLFHVQSNTLITEKNHQAFIAHGKMYDEVARLCMEYAQDLMMQEGNLEWTTVCSEKDIRALVSRYRCNKNTLLVVTGKGRVGAGIFSRRLLMTSGLEPVTALPFIREAVRRDMGIVVLDPNCRDAQMAMEVVETSLERLFFDDRNENAIYVLAHSMAGSQLVRFLLNKTTESLGENTINGNGYESPSDVETYLRQLKAVAFTDSNHNINWVKKHPATSDFLVGPRSLYIKSHKVHEDAKALGEAHHDCHYWRHRFGSIRTLWAGTAEHALTNHAARFHIWEHFDSFLHAAN